MGQERREEGRAGPEGRAETRAEDAISDGTRAARCDAAKKLFTGDESCCRRSLSHSEGLRSGAWETPSGEAASPLLSIQEDAQPHFCAGQPLTTQQRT